MHTTGVKLVLDTNVFITILSKRGENRWIFDKVINGEFILCLSNEMLVEYWEVLENKTSAAVAANVVEFLVSHPHIQLVAPSYRWNAITEDPDDNKFVDCYLASGAQYLLSNDRHFNVLKEIAFPKICRLTTVQFKELYDADQ